MTKERVEKTLIILEEAEVRQVLAVGRNALTRRRSIRFVTQVIGKKVEAALRLRCG